MNNTSDELNLFKDQCNKLRCPLCKSQLDGSISYSQASLYCANDNSEYIVVWKPNQKDPQLEEIRYYYSQYEYVIYTSKDSEDPNRFLTIICRYNRDISLRYKLATCQQLFYYIGRRFLFYYTRMEENVFLHKLKTYRIFS